MRSGGFDQDELDVLFRIDAIESVRDERARGVVQLGGELDTGCPAPMIATSKLRGAYRPGLGVGAQERIDRSLRWKRCACAVRVESDRIVAQRLAFRNRWSGCPRPMTERVVAEPSRRRHLLAILVGVRRNQHLAALAVEPDDLADPIAEVMADTPAQGSRSRRRRVSMLPAAISMQVRFPEVRARLFDQRDVRLARPTLWRRACCRAWSLSSEAPAPPPTTTIRCRSVSSWTVFKSQEEGSGEGVVMGLGRADVGASGNRVGIRRDATRVAAGYFFFFDPPAADTAARRPSR